MVKTKEEVHQKLTELLEPYLFEKVLSPSLKEEIEQALQPLEIRVNPISPHGPVIMWYRFPTDEKATFRRLEVAITPEGLTEFQLA